MSLGQRIVPKAEFWPWHSIFYIRVQSCESFQMYNSVSFCTTVSFRKWFLEHVLKLSDTILVHLNNKRLCSILQLYKLSNGWIFYCLFCPCHVNSIHLHTFNLIWLQEKKDVRDCCVFFQSSWLFWLLPTVTSNTLGWHQWGAGKRKRCSVLSQKDYYINKRGAKCQICPQTVPVNVEVVVSFVVQSRFIQ